MAYETGTASNHEDLWDRLISFLTTDPELVANNENWSVAWLADDSNSGLENDTDIVLRGPGLAQQDSVYVAMRRYDGNISQDISNFFFRGCTGVVDSAHAYSLHVNSMPEAVGLSVRNAPMDYWFTANGRRFMMVVQVGTVYESMYAGFFLPYGDPTVYNYPMFIGAMEGFGGPNSSGDWRNTGSNHTCPFYPNYDGSPTGYEANSWMLSPQGDWLRVAVNSNDAQAHLGPTFFGYGGGIGSALTVTNGLSGYGYNSVRLRMVEAYGEEYVLTPFTLVQASPGDQTFGILDGVYHVPGRGQSIENLISANDIVHAVFQNAFRTSIGSWFAVALYPEDSNSSLLEDSNS